MSTLMHALLIAKTNKGSKVRTVTTSFTAPGFNLILLTLTLAGGEAVYTQHTPNSDSLSPRRKPQQPPPELSRYYKGVKSFPYCPGRTVADLVKKKMKFEK